MIIFAGLGLNENTITREIIETIKNADKIYFERYTSPPMPYNEYKFDFQYEQVGREFIENGNKIIEESKNNTVVLLTYGNPMIATTHMDLRMRAEKAGIHTQILHNSSITTVLPGETGLHSYKFGRITTLMTKSKIAPLSVYDVILNNLLSGLHSTVLLEYNLDEDEYLDPIEAIKQLLGIEKEQKKQIINKLSTIIIASRIGMDKQKIYCGNVNELLKKQYDKPPYTIIIPSKLHFTEIEALVQLFGIKEEDIKDNSMNIKSISIDMLDKYIPKTKDTLNKIIEMTDNEKRYTDLFKNIDAYIDDARRFRDEERFELAILSIGYAEGLIDSLIFLGEVELEW